MAEEVLLNVSDVLCGSYTNGPGKRVAIWVQGCTLNCKGCFNKEKQAHIAKHLVDPVEFAHDIVSLCKRTTCEGITLTGGEPFQQAIALCKLTKIVKKSGLTITCFSGYPAHKILNSTDESIRNLLTDLDILIAGPFNIDNDCPTRKWHSDPDKEVIFLTEAYSSSQIYADENVEFVIKGESIHFTGFVDEHDMKVGSKIR